MSDQMKDVSLDQATNAQLRFIAEALLNLDDIKNGQTNAVLLAKIRAATNQAVFKLPVLQASEEKAPVDLAPAPEAAPANRVAGQHYRYDPKVTLTVQHTSDKTRSRDVFVTCNGDVIQIQRGVKVQIPYRHFLVLQNGVEQVPRDGPDINPVTGQPIKVFEEQPSYPYQVHEMPSDEEIAAFHARTDHADMQVPQAA